MTRFRGPQIDVHPDGLDTANLNEGILSADAAGRARMATDLFDSATVTAKFASSAIALDRLAEAVLQADGGQTFTGNQNAGGYRITNAGAGVASSDLATKGQVDAVSAGLDPKENCRLSTTATLTGWTTGGGPGVGKTLTSATTATSNNDFDGVTASVSDRILVRHGPTNVDNGIYTVTQLADGGSNYTILTRATDCDEDAEVSAGLFVFVTDGTAVTGYKGTGWIVIAVDPITVDTHAINFTQFSEPGVTEAGAGLTKSGVTLAVGQGNGLTVNADDVDVDYETVGNITTIQPDDAASAGTNNTAARGDHQHAISAAVPVNLGSANAEGTGNDFARATHVHARDNKRQEIVTSENITNTDTALTDTLDAVPVSDASVELFVNGQLQRQGAGFDYSISSQTITWLANTGTAFNMKSTDVIQVNYISQT